MAITTTEAAERLAKDTEIMAHMINLGERIQWGSETALMDKCAAMLRALAAERDALAAGLAKRGEPASAGVTEKALLALAELASIGVNCSLNDWVRISGAILAALTQPAQGGEGGA